MQVKENQKLKTGFIDSVIEHSDILKKTSENELSNAHDKVVELSQLLKRTTVPDLINNSKLSTRIAESCSEITNLLSHVVVAAENTLNVLQIDQEIEGKNTTITN